MNYLIRITDDTTFVFDFQPKNTFFYFLGW